MSKTKCIITKTIQPYDYKRKGKIVQVKASFPRKYHIKSGAKVKIVKKKVRQKPKADKIRALQVKEKDWAHLSTQYPNIIGLTDQQINKFIEDETADLVEFRTIWDYFVCEEYFKDEYKKAEIIASHPEVAKMDLQEFIKFAMQTYPKGPLDLRKTIRKNTLEKYISKIKCFNRADLDEISTKTYIELMNQFEEKNKNLKGEEFGNIDLWISKDKLDQFYHEMSELNDMKFYGQNTTATNEENKDDVRLSIDYRSFSGQLKFPEQTYYQLKNVYVQEQEAIKEYQEEHTIFLTSPRGGLEALSNFAYANNIVKGNLPYDLYKDEGYTPSVSDDTVGSRSLPYGARIPDVHDIVYLDDVCMSGEQQTKAYDELVKTLNDFKIERKEWPRLHYVALIGSNKVIQDANGKRKVVPVDETERSWESVTIGELHSFERDPKTYKYPDVSAIVLPFSIPDGEHHVIARDLYRSTDRYRHMKP